MKSSNAKLWIILIIAVAAYIGISSTMSKTADKTKAEQVDYYKAHPPGAKAGVKRAVMTPGRVVQFNTNKGVIEFVLFEKDCPKTTKRIASLVKDGHYDGVTFPRVEPEKLIQTALANKKVKPMNCEIRKGMRHVRGSVGMAHVGKWYDSNTSEIYILIEPMPFLDLEYTNFGRVINGMDVVMNIKKGDVIKSAKLRDLSPVDKKRFNEILTIESNRRTEQGE